MPRRTTLTAIYALYGQWAAAYTFACRKGCATCCTRSVTMTTLEAELIRDYVSGSRPDLLPLLDSLPDDAPTPSATTNQFAAACLRGEESADPSLPWDLRPCAFLQEGCCAIYPARPFMCRGFGSQVRCGDQGEAVVAPLLLTLNTVVMQVIEHLDQGRPWGNMNTLLRSSGFDGSGEQLNGGLSLRSRPWPGFLLLPEEEAVLREQVQTLLALLNTEKKGKGNT